PVRNFQTQPLGPNILSLTDSDVDRRISRVHPALRDQPERTALRRLVSQINFDKVIAGNALISASPKSVQILFIESKHHVGDAVAFIIARSSDLVRRRDGCDSQFCRWDYEALINENLCAGWMVDYHQTELVIVVRFPQLARDTQVVMAVTGDELIAAYLVPFFGRFNPRSAQRVNAQP